MKKIVFTFLILMVFILSSCTGLEARAFAKELQRGFESRMDFSGVTHSSNLQGTEEDETMSFTVNNKGYYYTETDEEVKSANLEYEYVYKKIENKLYLFKSFLRDESDYSPDFSKVLVDLMDRYKVISIEEGIYDKNSVYILTLEANNGNKQVYYVEKETYLVLKENYFLSEETCKFLNNFMLENNIDFSNTNCLLKSNYLTDIKINTGITDDFFDLRTQFPDAE
ncbi:MAG: hypothetical protein KKH40_02470, partial [Nanoarchaeota archaeon]|nr:hypothetical protein [Nanoarchaeota archaeon]